MNKLVVKLGAVQSVCGVLFIMLSAHGFSHEIGGIELLSNGKISLVTKLLFVGAILAPIGLLFTKNKIAIISISFSALILFIMSIYEFSEQKLMGTGEVTSGGSLFIAGMIISLFGATYQDVIESDLWQFMMERKKWWLLPMIIVLLLIGILLVFGGNTAVAPFVYTLF